MLHVLPEVAPGEPGDHRGRLDRIARLELDRDHAALLHLLVDVEVLLERVDGLLAPAALELELRPRPGHELADEQLDPPASSLGGDGGADPTFQQHLAGRIGQPVPAVPERGQHELLVQQVVRHCELLHRDALAAPAEAGQPEQRWGQRGRPRPARDGIAEQRAGAHDLHLSLDRYLLLDEERGDRVRRHGRRRLLLHLHQRRRAVHRRCQEEVGRRAGQSDGQRGRDPPAALGQRAQQIAQGWLLHRRAHARAARLSDRHPPHRRACPVELVSHVVHSGYIAGAAGS